jgi:hypothetical protein
LCISECQEQSINELVYEEEGDYFVGRLNRMWVQEQPLASIEVVDGNRWGTFQGNYFIKIEIADLLQHQRSVRHLENDASSIGVTDAASLFSFVLYKRVFHWW